MWKVWPAMLKSSFFILKIKKKMEHCEDEGRAVVRTNENWLRRHTLWTEETHRIWNWIVWGTRRRQEAVVEKFGEHVIRNMMQFYRCWNEITCNSNLLPFSIIYCMLPSMQGGKAQLYFTRLLRFENILIHNLFS